jgi:Divergent InlB B-repeat domain/Abnormal spindle-like microcephaly-assoc'd, ASPM-SPD-2-Hydin
MKRPRLSRPFTFTLVALAGLIALSYFPLARIRAANAGATILPSAGKPLVNLKSPQTLKITYAGSTDAVAALQGGTATATALAAADFNADGAMDVVAGYSANGGGVLAILRGNPDAFAPKDPTLYQKAMKGSVPATFLSKASAFSLPESPDLLVTGDFNHDGNKDVLVAARGSNNLYLLAGDGTGNLLAPQVVPILGQVRAFATTDDGHVAVSMDSPNGSQLAIFASSSQGLTAGASYELPASGDSVAWGNLGGGMDVAVGAGSNVVLVYSALTAKAQTETVTVPFKVQGLTLGDFIWDRDGRTEISVLADDGSIHILQHGTLNTAPLTVAELPARRAALRGRHTQPTTAPNPTALGAWTVAKQLPYTGSAPAGPVSPSAFNSPRLAASSTHDLMVLDAGRGQLNILDTSGTAASPSAGISFSGTPVAALALPQKINASRDVVVLTSSQSVPTLITSNASVTLNVNTTADIDTISACTTSTTSIPTTLSLREAVCLANNLAPDTTTINLPAGTYDLTSLETGELQQGTGNSYSLSIVGAVASNTIIQQTDGHDRILEEDFVLNGNNPVAISNVTMDLGSCKTGTDCSFGGGAILAGGVSGDNLTLTNVVFGNNSVSAGGGDDDGGAVNDAGGGLTITSSTFSSNTTDSTGGGLFFTDQGVPNGEGSVTITNSTFSGNTDATAGGGGAYVNLDSGFTLTVSGSTFTGNKVTGGSAPGGGIFAEQGGSSTTTVTVSNSRFVGNSDPVGGTGIAVDEATANLQNNWWGCNAGPGASGCDSVAINAGGSFNPWLVLSVSANPTQIFPNGTSQLTADLTHNSSGTGGFSVPTGTPVSFGGTLDSSVNPSSTTLTSGQANSTYTAGSSAGNGTGTATVDNQPVTATINILDSVTVTTSPANLAITVDGVTSTAPQTFNWVVGSSHTIATTSPQAGPTGSQYVFDNWSDSGSQTHSVTAPAATTTYTASFDTQYQLTTVASPSADGSVIPPSGGYFASGAPIPVAATANAGFAFSNWTSTGGSFDSTTSATTNFHMPAAATTVTGNFVPSTTQVTITTNPANLLVSVDGGSFTPAPLVETWNQGSSHTIATTSPQAGATGVQYVFSSWSDSGAISHGITVPPTATTYTASFVTQYQLTTAANPSAGGTVSPPSGNFYTSGTVVPLAATANAGYTFTNWTGNVANSTSASTSITMTAPQSVTANFSLIIVASPTTTSVSSSNNPSFTTPPANSVTFTATVTSNTTVNEGTVTFSDPANDFTCSGGNTVPVSNGQAACTTSFSTEGARNITAAYNGTVNFQAGSGFITQTVNNHTVITGNQFCNQGAITVPSTAGASTPYPSNIFVTGLSGNVGAVTVNLNNINSSNIAQTDLLLVGPTGAQIIPFASVGDSSTINGVNVTLDDSASSLIPGGSPLTTGSYKPTSITGSTSLVFPAPAPTVTAANYAATDGAATLTSTFQNTAPNGTWALYAMDNSGNGAASIGGGWCVNISPPAVQTTITTSPAGLLVSVDGGTATTAPLVENWVPGSSHTIATTSPQSGGTGVQYVFSSWSDSGAISHSITVPSTATTYTASFNTQYQLTTQASPPADGSVTPASGGYYAAGAAIPVTATANAGFTFSNWTSTGGSFGSTTSASTNFTMPAAPATVTGNFGNSSVQITITTTPANLLVSVDGGTATAAPLVENWVIGSSHTIATTSPQSGGTGVQYVWSNWSDSGAISHSITVPGTATTYTAAFNTQYQLTTQASPPADGTVTPASGGYYASGATIPVTATANAGFQFSNWTSTGGTFDSTTSASTNFHMPSAPATVTGNFATSAVQITVTTSPAHLLVSVDGGTATAAPLVESWIPGSSHTIATTSPQSGGTGIQYVFSSWSDSGAISHSITVPPSSTTYTASFNTQYQLTTQASPPADGTVAPASGSYYASGASIPVTATANAGFQFSNWTSTGGSFDSTTSASTNFHMPAAPATVTGNFATSAVQITVTTSPAHLLVSVDGGTATAAPLVESWVPGSSHTIATTSPQSGGTGVQYLFSSWSDSGAISHSITVPSSATTYTASFATQYQLTTAANPSNGGTVSPASGSFYNSGAIVPLSATANAGFTFVNWTGNVANSTSASTTITMTAPQSVTANFATSAQITINPTSINFGTTYLLNLKAANVTVKNTGTATLNIGKVSLTYGSGTNKADFSIISLCPPTLAAGKSCIIGVFFFAGNIGNLSATLNIADNAPGSPQQVPLSATVINPIPFFRPGSLNFGTVKVGHSSTQNVTLMNVGTTPLNISSVSATGPNANNFVPVNGCPSSLGPGNSCIIAVKFSPSATGNRSANLTVVDNAEIGRQNIPLSGKGN